MSRSLAFPLTILQIMTLGLTSSPCWANLNSEESFSNPGKSIELKEDFVNKPSPPFKYWPTDEQFWIQYKTFHQKKQFKKVVKIIQQQIQRFGEDTPEGSEARLAMSQFFLTRKYSYASFLTLIHLAQNQIGTQVGMAALHELSLLTKNFLYDQRALTNLMNSNDFDNLHPDIQSFVSYHKAIRNMIFGYNKWARKHISQIQPNSHWGHLFQYWGAVGEVARDHIESALTQFTILYENKEVASSLRQQASLQLARLAFEKGQFEKASQLYSQLEMPEVRERGRIQLERIWTQYYMGNYAKALGLLYALRSPYFRSSLNPERFLLEMLIYRELCHYEAIPLITKEFHSTYRKAIRDISRRRPLQHNKILLNMTLMDKSIQELANLIHQIRLEKKRLKRDKLSRRLIRNILTQYDRLDKKLQMQIDFQIERKTRQIANELLDVQEQIMFMSYLSKLDALRITRRGEKRDYASERVSKVTFEYIYWPVEKKFGIMEHWTDEFEDYKMLISSRCQDPDSGKGVQEKELERGFK